ncbi:MAG: pilus assembly protein PilM [Deltaproteobacteria bacterium]|nr:pilus assembly protein PilM [Deltaproteobacteria bacterium]
MPQTILGVDVGSYSVKVAEIVRSFKRFAFIHFYERRIQYSEVLTREESIAAAVQGVLEDNALTWDAAYVAMPGRAVATRFVDFPFGQAKKIDQAIEFEIENHIPFPIDDLVLDYHVTHAAKDAASVLVFYAHKAEFVKYLTLLGNAGVDPKRVCVEGVELVNLVNMGLVPPDVPYAILDVGHEKTAITICHGKRFIYTRTLTIGGRHITQAIAERLNISADEAERLKLEMGQAHVEGPWPPEDSIPFHVMKGIDGVLEDLLLQIRQTLMAYRERGEGAVEGMYLSGGTTRLAGFEQYLSIRLKQNVTPLNAYEFHFSQIERTEAPVAVIPQALALALRGVAVPGLPDVNFRRGEFAYRGDVQELGGGLRRAAIAAGLVVALAIGYFCMQYFTLTRKAAALDKEVVQLVTQAIGGKKARQLGSASAALKLLQSGEEEMKTRVTRLEAVVAVSPLAVLKSVAETLPPRDQLALDVDKFELKEGKVLMVGRTTSFEAVDKIREALGKAEAFDDVQTSNVAKGLKDEIKFEVRMGVKGMGPALPPAPKGKTKGKAA